MSKVKDQNYFVIHGWMLNELKLKGNELLVYALIYGFSQDGETKFRGSISYVVDFTGASRGTVINSLNSLTEKQLLVKFSESKNGVIFNEYKAIPPVQKLHYPGIELTPPPSSIFEPNNNTLDNKEKEKTYTSKFDGFLHWVKNHAKRVSNMHEPFTEDQYKKISEDYTKEQIIDIISGMHNWGPLNKRVSAYLTFLNWATRNYPKNNKPTVEVSGFVTPTLNL